MIPPLMSSTMSGSSMAKSIASKNGSSEESGRPELPDEQKSEKTIANKESM